MKKDEIKNSADLFFYKASADYNAAKLLFSFFNSGEQQFDLEVVLFHLQQSVEKLIKALLSHGRIETPRTLDLEKLVNAVLDEGIHIPDIDFLFPLTQFAVEGTYSILLDDIHETEEYIHKTASLIEFTAEYLLK